MSTGLSRAACPRISVVMSVYNERLEWLKQSIESILRQSFGDIEFVIIVDNPELDEECLSYLEDVASSDDRIRLFKNNENIGLARSLNEGLRHVRGEFIARMDADDISFTNRLDRELAEIESKHLDMVSASKIDMDEDGNAKSESTRLLSNPYAVLPYSNIVVHPSVMIRTEVMRSLGGYRNFYNSEDYDMWLRVLSGGYSIGIISEPLIFYRVRASSMSQKNMAEAYHITRYQQRLYRQRKRSGKDDFTEERFLSYIDSKDCSASANKRYMQFRMSMDKAIADFKERDMMFIPEALHAFLYYPTGALANVIAVVRSVIDARTNDRG